MTESRRDDFPNNYVGDLVHDGRGWVVVPPTCCPDGHDNGQPGWSVSSVWCTCNGPAYGVATLVRQNALRAPARCRLPDPGPGPGFDVGSRTTAPPWLAFLVFSPFYLLNKRSEAQERALAEAAKASAAAAELAAKQERIAAKNRAAAAELAAKARATAAEKGGGAGKGLAARAVDRGCQRSR